MKIDRQLTFHEKISLAIDGAAPDLYVPLEVAAADASLGREEWEIQTPMSFSPWLRVTTNKPSSNPPVNVSLFYGILLPDEPFGEILNKAA